MKNYIVKFKNVKGKNGLSKMVNYLFSENHSSHSKTKIINVGRTTKKDFISSVIEKENSNSLKVQQQRKGGRPSSFYGKSITLNFPPTVWADILKNPIIINDILKEVYKDISKYLNVEEDIFLNNVLSVLHLQKNPHIHFIIPSIIETKKNRELVNKSFMKFLKYSFTKHTDKTFNRQINHYKPTEKSYSKKEIIIQKNQNEKLIQSMKKLVLNLMSNLTLNPKELNYLNQILKDLDKGHTQKAQKKIDKFKH